jgi:16S rRNA (guanine(966)-N(2))-methyltransferase RsmD
MSGLRVIGGKARGRHLRSVPGDTTRPITDRTKEALFNILGNDLVDATLLDLFAGTGAVGIEALSRGACFVRFLDTERRAIETIKKNLETTGLCRPTDRECAEVLHGNSFTHLQGNPDRAFDYIYIAPPQYKEMWKKALTLVDTQPGWLAEDVWVIVQIDPVEYEPISLINLAEFDQRRYGSTLLVFYARPLETESL